MAAPIVTNCLVCATQIESPPSQPRKFCSHSCYHVAQRAGMVKCGGPAKHVYACYQCGSMVQRKFGKRRNGAIANHIFCCRACYDQFRRENVATPSGPKRRPIGKLCAHCSKPILSHGGKKYCGMACKVAANKPKPHRCVNCGVEFSAIKYIKRDDGLFHVAAVTNQATCSAKCANQWIRNNPERKRKIGLAFSGDKHPNWQGGKAQLNNTSNRGPNWNAQRNKARKRDGYRCVDCGMSEDQCHQMYGRGLDVDHVVPFHNFSSYKLANRLGNLESRCASCHRITEAKRTMVQMVLPMQDKRHRQHRGYVHGVMVNTAKLTAPDVIAIRKRFRSGEQAASLAREYGVGKGTVANAARGVTWKHVPL